jgi:hypothetical protein
MNICAQMMNPNKIHYFLQNAKIEGQPLFNVQNKRQWFAYRQQRGSKEIEIKLLRYMLWVNRKTILYVLIRLKYIHVTKQVFVLDLKQGKELMIPPELRTDNFPMSMRFYDPIFRILELQIEDETKFSFTTQRNINMT